MTIVLSALLSSVSMACFMWAIVHYRMTRSAIEDRLSDPGTIHLPYHLPDQSRASKPFRQITLDDSYNDKLTRQLFLAGLRSEKNSSFYRFLLKLTLILPVVLILYYFLTSSLSLKNFTLALLFGPVFYLLIQTMIKKARIKRQEIMTATLPQFFDLLVVCIEAGLNFTSALPRVIQEMEPGNPLIQEFDLLHKELMGGLSVGEACDRLARRCDVVDLSVILSSIVQSDQMGSGLAHVLRVQSRELRDKQRQRMREKAYRIPIKLLFPMAMIFLTLFAVTFGPAMYQLANQLSDISLSGTKVSVQAGGV